MDWGVDKWLGAEIKSIILNDDDYKRGEGRQRPNKKEAFDNTTTQHKRSTNIGITQRKIPQKTNKL
jgi:hypothetical protein